jgi:hypothetical protein
MPNKAFGLITSLRTWGSQPPDYRFEYSVINSSNAVVTQDASVYVPVAYTDRPYDVWSNIVAAVRAQESDASLIVVNAPSSLDYFLFGRAY